MSDQHLKFRTSVQIEKMETDPMALRVSLGGNEKDGYYLRYRGDRDAVLKMLIDGLKSFEIYTTMPELDAKPNTPPPAWFKNS